VSGVGVVEQRGAPEGGEEEDQPETGEEEKSERAPGGARVAGCGEFGGCFEEKRRIDHEFVVLFQHKWVTW
jgi:hypothetical protein